MDEETKQKLIDAGLDDVAEALEKSAQENAKALEDMKAAHEKTVAEKDAVIAQKNQDLVGQRKEFKKLADMTAEEKSKLTEKELEFQQRQEEFEAKQQEFTSKEIASRREAAIKRLAGDDKDLAEKVAANFDRIKDSDKAQTAEEMETIAREAFNMTGTPAPDPIRSAVFGGGNGEAPGGKQNDFSETEQGQQLASMLGVKIAPEEGAK